MISIKRELASRIVVGDFNSQQSAVAELRALLAAPVVERQPISDDELLSMADKAFGQVVDYDFMGGPITDYRVLTIGAYGPAVRRIVELARQHPVAQPELAELQATIDRLETQVANAINLDFERREEIARLTAEIERLKSESFESLYNAVIDERDALAERLKGGQGEPVALSIPDECPHLIMFDDTERENLLFSGAGARSAALKTWEKISMSWNAHLFVRVERNSRDDRYPSATVSTSQPAPVSVADSDQDLMDRHEAWKAGEAHGINSAAKLIEKRMDDYANEHGSRDPETGSVEFPGNGEEYVGELMDIIEQIQELVCLDKVKELNQ